MKVFIALSPADWHDCSSESLWALPVGDSLYKLRNVPFYAMDLSYDDTVFAKLKDNILWFDRVHARGGYSTYRFIVMNGISEAQWSTYWQQLEQIGCTYERAKALFAVDVPPEADIYNVYALLGAGEKAGVWGFQEAHCGHSLRKP